MNPLEEISARIREQAGVSFGKAPEAAYDADPVDAITRVAEQRGIDPGYLIGLAKLETAMGSKTIKGDGEDTRNLFNIKDFSGKGGIRALDKAEGSNDAYRQYASYEDSAHDLVDLLERKYPNAVKAQSPRDFADALKQGGYATDPKYADKLTSVIGGNQERKPQANPFAAFEQANQDIFAAADAHKATGWKARAAAGVDALKRSITLSGLALTGSADSDAPEKMAEVISNSIKNSLAQTQDAKEIDAAIAPAVKEYNESSGEAAIPKFGKVMGTMAWEYLKHPKEAINQILENLPNSVPGLVAGAGGAAAGGLAGPGGALAGGIAAGTAAGVIPEFGSEIEQRIRKKMDELRLDPRDPVAMAKVIRDNYQEFQDKALAKGITTSAVDALATRLTFGLGSMGERMVSKEANAVSRLVADKSISAAQGAEKMATIEAMQAARNTMGRKALRGSGETVGEMAGEGASEGLGRIATGDEFDPVDAAKEALLAVGQGGAMAAGGSLTNKALGINPATSAEQSISRLGGLVQGARDFEANIQGPARPSVEDISKATSVDQAIAVSAAAVGMNDVSSELAGQIDRANVGRDLVNRAQQQAELNSFIASESRDLNTLHAQTMRENQKRQELDAIYQQSQTDLGRLPDQQVAAATAATDEAPTAMQLAMQRARQKTAAPIAPTVQVTPEPVAPPAVGTLPGDVTRADGTPFISENGARLKLRELSKRGPHEVAAVEGGFVVRPSSNLPETVSRVQDVAPPVRTEAQAAPVEAPAPAGSDAQPAAGIPGTGAVAPALESDGVVTPVRPRPNPGQTPSNPGQTPSNPGQTPVQTEVARVRAGRSSQSTPEVVHLGVNNTPLHEGGRPFKTQRAAKDAKKLQPMMRVVSVKNGFALKEKSGRMLEAEAKRASKLAAGTTGDKGTPQHAHGFIAREGGLSKATMSDIGMDKNSQVGSLWMFRKEGGMSLEQATEKLIEGGYLKEGASHSDAAALIKRSVTSPQYTADGWSRIAEAEAQTQFEDHLAAQEEAAQNEDFDPFDSLSADGFTTQDDILAGYSEASDPIKLQVNADIANAESLGIDIDLLREESYEATRNGSEQDYLEHLARAIEEAITRGEKDRSNDAGQPVDSASEGQGAKQDVTAEDLFGEAPNASQQAAENLRRQQEDREQVQRNAAPGAEGFELGMVDSRNGNEVAPGQQEIGKEPAAEATAILDAAEVRGKERIDVLKDVKSGAITPEEVKAAYPAKDAATESSDLEKDLQSKAHPKESDGDVGVVMPNGKVHFVSIDDAVSTAKQAIERGIKAVPFQIHNETGIRLGDVDRVLAEINATPEPTATIQAETGSSEDAPMFSRTSGETTDQTQTPEFKRWFGDSKVVNADGKPLVVYHGTSNDQQGEAFTMLDTYASNYGLFGQGAYLTADPSVASEYTTKGRGKSPSVYPLYAAIKNPIDMDAAADPQQWVDAYPEFDIEAYHEGGSTNESYYRAVEEAVRDEGMEKWEGSEAIQDGIRRMGYDGITHIGGGRVKSDGKRHQVFIAFEPEQIKSAIGNNGQFDPQNPDIRFIKGAKPQSGASTAAVKSWVQSLTAKWKNPPAIRIVESIADLPVDAPDDVRGLYFKGTVYVVSSQVKSRKDVGTVLMHEAIAHHGLRDMLGREAWTKMMANIQLAIKSGNKALTDIRNHVRSIYVDDDGNFNLSPAQEADEIAARAVELGIDPDGNFKPGFAFLKSVFAKVVQFLRELGLDVQFTNLELHGALVNAMQHLESGSRGEASSPAVVAASRDGDAPMFSRSQIIGQTNRKYDPAQIRAMENVGFKVEVPTIKERIQALTQDMGKKMAQGIVDQFAPVKDLDKESYGLLRLAKGASGAFEAFLKGGKLKLTDGVYDFDDANRGGVLDKLLIPLGGEHHDFLRWVAANRAERLKAEGKENLFSDTDIEALKRLNENTTDFDYTLQHGARAGQTTRDRTLVYGDALKTFNEFSANVLDMAEQSGLIDGASRHLWEHEFYVPFYRVEEDGGFRGMSIKGAAVRQEAFKKLKGGKNELNADLLDNTLMNWAHLLDASAKNRAAKATIEAAERAGIAVIAPQSTVQGMASSIQNKRGVVWFMDGGEKRYSMVDDPYILTALSSLEYAGMNNPVMNAMSTFKHMLTVGVTASPFFKVRNLIRDSVQVIGTGNISYNPAKNLAQGWKLTDPKSDAYFRLLAGGGTIHFGSMMEGSEAKRVQALVESGVDDSTVLNSDKKVKAFYRKWIEPGVTAYNELGNRGEAVNRAALYDQLRKQGVSHADASLQARDLMDFSMQGSFATVRFLTQVVPFMNARLQGLYKLGKSAKEDPTRFGIVLGATAALSVGLLAAYADDEDWRKREDWDRNNYWWFKFGGTAFRIPKPFEIGSIATLAERGFELAFDKEMTNKRFMAQVMTLAGDNLSMNPIPQLVKPLLDVYANKDAFTGRPIESMGMERLKSEYRFTGNTSMAARGISSGLNSVSELFGKEALSPVQVDHMLRGYFGWLGSFVVGSSDLLARPATEQPTKATPDYWKVATGGIASDLRDAPSRYVSQIYTQAKEIEQAYGTWKSLVKEGKALEAADFLEDHRDEIMQHKQVNNLKSSLSKLNERIRIIERSSMDPDVKREKIREIQLIKDQRSRLAPEPA